MTARPRRAARHGRCPECGATSEQRTRPFCSSRCRNRDLARWLDGAYAVPVVEENGAEAEFTRDEDR